MGADAVAGPVVFIVEDDDAVRDAIGMLLRAAGLPVQTFGSALEFLRQYRPEWRGCLILDVRMPGMSGLELQDTLYKRRCRMPIVFLTAHGDVPMVVRAMKNGAIDFLEKPHDATRLVLVACRALRVAAEDEDRLATGLRVADGAEQRVASLTKREREVLVEVLRGRSTRTIAESLCVSVKTVEFHRGRLRRKLGVSSLAELFGLFAAPRSDGFVRLAPTGGAATAADDRWDADAAEAADAGGPQLRAKP